MIAWSLVNVATPFDNLMLCSETRSVEFFEHDDVALGVLDRVSTEVHQAPGDRLQLLAGLDRELLRVAEHIVHRPYAMQRIDDTRLCGLCELTIVV